MKIKVLHELCNAHKSTDKINPVCWSICDTYLCSKKEKKLETCPFEFFGIGPPNEINKIYEKVIEVNILKDKLPKEVYEELVSRIIDNRLLGFKKIE